MSKLAHEGWGIVNIASTVLLVLGISLLVTAIAILAFRDRIANNMSHAKVIPTKSMRPVRYVVLLAVGQIVFGAMSIVVSIALAAREGLADPVAAIAAITRSTPVDPTLLGVLLLLTGALAIIGSVFMFNRAWAHRDQWSNASVGIHVPPTDARKIFLAIMLCVLGAISALTGAVALYGG